MLSARGMFAVNNNAFDMERLIGHFNAQYLEYLQKSVGYLSVVEGSDHSPDAVVLHGTDDDEHAYPGYRVLLDDPVVLDHFHDFLVSHQVSVQKNYQPDDHYFALTISKASLTDAGLTYQQEGEYLFSLNKKLKGCLAQLQEKKQQHNENGLEGLRL